LEKNKQKKTIQSGQKYQRKSCIICYEGAEEEIMKRVRDFSIDGLIDTCKK
jgi:hypothetical protein